MELKAEPAEMPPRDFPQPSLSMTERRVGSLLAAGCTEAEVAARLLLNAETVAWVVAKLCRTLEVEARPELVALLRELSSS